MEIFAEMRCILPVVVRTDGRYLKISSYAWVLRNYMTQTSPGQWRTLPYFSLEKQFKPSSLPTLFRMKSVFCLQIFHLKVKWKN